MTEANVKPHRRRARLAAAVHELLQANAVVTSDGYRYTRPARRTYPHQWLWDSCFHARIHALCGDRAAAHDELRALFRAQVKTGPDRGRIPHMTFFGGTASEAGQDEAGTAQYTRDVALWGDPQASSITQPPIVAETVLEVGDRALWRELWTPLTSYYDWWLRRRDSRGDGLLVCHHVWETGADATPHADAAMARLTTTGRTPQSVTNATINLDAKKRPDLLAARFLMLEDLQEIDRSELAGTLAEPEATRRRLALYGHIAVDIQAYAIGSLEALARIGDALGHRDSARYAAAAARIADTVNRQLWDDGLGYYTDRWGDPAQPATTLTYAPLIALAGGNLVPQPRADRLLGALVDPARFWTQWPVPTIARDDNHFDADEYWRGSTWININWLIVRGLCSAARRFADGRYLPPARTIAERTVLLVEQAGFREYYRSIIPAVPGCVPRQGFPPRQGLPRVAKVTALPSRECGVGSIHNALSSAADTACVGLGAEGFGWSGLALDFCRALDEELSGVEPLPCPLP